MQIFTHPLIWVFMIFLMSPETSVRAQTEPCSTLTKKQRYYKAREAVNHVESGVVVVEFRNYNKQLDYYDEMLSKDGLSESGRRSYQKRRDSWKNENEEWIKSVMQAFKDNYTLGEVRFVLRSARGKYGNEDAQIWLNNNLEKTRMVPLADGRYVILSQGVTRNQGLKAFLFLDQKMNSMCSPMPAYFRLNTWRTLFKVGKTEDEYKALMLVRNFQKSIAKAKENL